MMRISISKLYGRIARPRDKGQDPFECALSRGLVALSTRVAWNVWLAACSTDRPASGALNQGKSGNSLAAGRIESGQQR
jgi:hypothetical protein